MSLQAAAQHLSSQGRGPDTTLVHMSRDEVKGLNDLAMAHGGQLTINPQTGLPEAGFLSSLLPMIGGAALSAMGMPPMMASLVMGGITGVSSGSLSKGLMAGLGAYGGAGMMGGLMGAGEGALAAQGVQAGMPQFAGDTAKYVEQVNALRASELAKVAEAPFMDKAKAGFSQIGEAPGQFFKDNWKYAAAAAAPVLAAPQTATKQPEIKADTDPGQRYTYSPGRTDVTELDPSGREQTYFQPKFTPISQPQAKNIYGYAGGGPVEEMSNANAIGANTGYPMADINKGAYATPYQTPISRNVLQGVSDTGVNPMTGEMNFADGGITGQGDLQLNIPLDIGGGGGGQFGRVAANGYQAVGSGGIFGSGFGAQPQNETMLSPAVQPTGQFGQTNNQGLGGLAGLLGNLGGRAQPPATTYEQYLAGRSPMQQNVQLTQDQWQQAQNQMQHIPQQQIGMAMTAPYARFKEGGSIASYQDGGYVPDKYDYDPLTQMFKKIEAMPSDNQVQTNQPAEPLPTGGGYNSNQGNQTPGTRALPTAMVEGGGKITPMAYPSLALSKVGDAVTNGLGYLAFKMSKPNPNPQYVQFVDAGDMLNSPSTLADTQAKADANNAQQAQAISAALSALQGVGPSGSGLSAGFGTPGATSGNAGAMGFGPAGMAGQATGVAGSGAGLHGAGGGGMSAGFGAPGATSGNAGAMGTGPSGMAATTGAASAAAAAGAANGGLMAAYANGGSHLGDYSDGGRLLRGPGDGVSDSIPAMIGKKQPARLADGEFVVPARIVSELGNGSTEAGARKLYAMMDRIQKARGKTVGKGKVAKNSRSEKYLPA